MEKKPKYTVGVIHDMKNEWRWVIIEMGLVGSGKKPLESSVTYPTREDALKGGYKLARNLGFSIARGGARKGAGRKPTGRTVTTSSINLTPELWTKLDTIRGEQSRSGWISERIKKAKS